MVARFVAAPRIMATDVRQNCAVIQQKFKKHGSPIFAAANSRGRKGTYFQFGLPKEEIKKG